jgi:putative PIN family toxin of toxin-antitoxin system
MKVFFDTNVYVSEALDGRASIEMIRATQRAGWRIQCSDYVLAEVRRVLVEVMGFSAALAGKSVDLTTRRAHFVTASPSRHQVPGDSNDSPILNGAMAGGADYLVTNDRHLLSLNPYEGIRIISMTAYYDLLVNEGLIHQAD